MLNMVFKMNLKADMVPNEPISFMNTSPFPIYDSPTWWWEFFIISIEVNPIPFKNEGGTHDARLSPSSIYSCSIGHILEHEFFSLGRLGSSGSKEKKVDLSYSEQLLRVVLSTFCGQKKSKISFKDILVSALKNYRKWLLYIFFLFFEKVVKS